MTDRDNLRDRIAELIDPNAWKMHRIPEMPGWPESTELIEPSREKAQAIIDELRTDEAVERVADWLCEDDNGYKLSGHDEWCQDPACDLVESYRKSARDLIAALLGEDA